MKRLITAIAIVGALSAAMVAPAIAADLSNGDGQACSGTGTWHFVNNQTGGAGPGVLVALFSVDGGAIVYVTGPDAVNKNNQHFYVTTEGDAVLVDASTDLDGRLVLSDFDCDDGGKKDPPKK